MFRFYQNIFPLCQKSGVQQRRVTFLQYIPIGRFVKTKFKSLYVHPAFLIFNNFAAITAISAATQLSMAPIFAAP